MPKVKIISAITAVFMAMTMLPANVLAQTDFDTVEQPISAATEGNAPNEILAPTLLLAPAPISTGEQTLLDISKGSVIIGDGTLSAFDDTGAAVTAADPDGYIIQGTSTANTIKVESGIHKITLRGVDISSASASPFEIAAGAKADVVISGANKLSTTFASACGLSVPENARLTISGTSADTLDVTGASGGAGIGGASGIAGGEITITDGTIKAIGGSGAAGIGGGAGAAQTSGNVIINGGVVNVTGGENNAAIWSGSIKIEGNTLVFVTGFDPDPDNKHLKPTVYLGRLKGILFEGNDGQLLAISRPVMPNNAVIPAGKTLKVDKNQTLIIAENNTFTNNGTINNFGTVSVNGKMKNTGEVNNSGLIRVYSKGSFEGTAPKNSETGETRAKQTVNAATMSTILEGEFTIGAALDVKNIANGDSGYDALFAQVDKTKNDIIQACEIKLNGKMYGSVKLHFTLGEAYKDKTVKILHLKADGKTETFSPVCTNGKISITTTELSPFMLVVEKAPTPPVDPKPTPPVDPTPTPPVDPTPTPPVDPTPTPPVDPTPTPPVDPTPTPPVDPTPTPKTNPKTGVRG